jgi:exopolysaccharide biosynthesis predicted pyruvyltransferase EpsI
MDFAKRPFTDKYPINTEHVNISLFTEKNQSLDFEYAIFVPIQLILLPDVPKKFNEKHI